MRKIIGGIMIIIAITSTAHSATSDEYPNKPVKIVIPYNAGGGLDVVGRMLAKKLNESLGQPFVFEFRPGAASTVGAAYAARAMPDGYTLFLSLRAITVSPSVYKKLSFDPEKSFEPISLVTNSINILSVHPSVPALTLSDLISYAKVHPKKIDFSSSGVGGDQHLSVEMFLRSAHIKMTHIPFNGGNPAATAVVSGEVDMMLMPGSFGYPFIKSGRLRPLAINGSPVRLARLPGVPTFAEAGFNNLSGSWSALLAPKGTPREIIVKLNEAVNKALETNEAKAYYHEHFLLRLGGTEEVLRKRIHDDVIMWRKVVKEVGIKPQ